MTTTLTMERRGLFDVSVYKILEEDALRRETVFGCEVSIPGTSYRIREETMYFPGKGEMTLRGLRSTSSSGSESSINCYISGLLTVSSLQQWHAISLFCSALPDHVGQLQSGARRIIRRLAGAAPRGGGGVVEGLLSPRLRRLPGKVESL